MLHSPTTSPTRSSRVSLLRPIAVSLTLLVIVTSCLVILSPNWAAGQGGAHGFTPYDLLRQEMVKRDILGNGIKNPRVVAAMAAVPRHEFVSPDQRRLAYFDMSLPIGYGQTISGTFVVAYMTEQLDPQPEDRVLEIGTGSGYQAAVLSLLVREVYTVEIVAPLAKQAETTLRRLGYNNVFVKAGDGYLGWPEHAPFDKIIVTCSPENVPQPLIDQLKEGGRMIIPVGERYHQMLYLFKKVNGKLVTEALKTTLFVPMTGVAESQRTKKPDPDHPSIVNGDFEEPPTASGEPPGWYYCRQAELRQNDGAPSGNVYLLFRNEEVGQVARALQGFPVNGKTVRGITVTCFVRAQNIRPGRTPQESSGILITFFDENRKAVGEVPVGPFFGTVPWRRITQNISVPPLAREAIIALGMTGATGELSVDAVEIGPTPPRRVPRP